MSFKFLKKGNTVCLWQLVSWPVSHFWDIWSRNSFRFTYYLWYTYLLILYILHYGNSKAIMSISHFLLISWLSWILALILIETPKKLTKWFLMHVICNLGIQIQKSKMDLDIGALRICCRKKNTDHNALIGFWFNSPVTPSICPAWIKVKCRGSSHNVVLATCSAVLFCLVNQPKSH